MGRAGGQITTKKTFGKKSANPRKAGKVQKVQKLKKQIVPGSVLILLAGRFRGRRVVFLKQLESGLLLVTGPFAINGVPLRRVNQRYCIATSAKTDVKGADVSTISDAYFAKEARVLLLLLLFLCCCGCYFCCSCSCSFVVVVVVVVVGRCLLCQGGAGGQQGCQKHPDATNKQHCS
ncbi:unnamed protein product [Polarella glacialis]|uniref:60S ribosomal protein L6 n=1 Tax=Polarella glacialis TaxID=89957 RepID=A0A813K776_POLGL|nr:unnamed protein product [Polarella glacialis]